LLGNSVNAHFDQLEVIGLQNDIRELLCASMVEEVEFVGLVTPENVLDGEDDVILIVAVLHLVEQSHHGLQDDQAVLALLDEVVVHGDVGAGLDGESYDVKVLDRSEKLTNAHDNFLGHKTNLNLREFKND